MTSKGSRKVVVSALTCALLVGAGGAQGAENATDSEDAPSLSPVDVASVNEAPSATETTAAPTPTATTTPAGASNTATVADNGSGMSWGELYSRYLSAGTVGDCASCHAQAGTASGAYDWLAAQQYMNGTPYLADPRTSCFSWLGGDMPPDGPDRFTKAVRDFASWGAAGARND